MAQDELLSTGEAAKELNCTVQNVSHLVRSGRIKDGRFVGGRWLITRAALEQYKAQLDDKPPDKKG